MQVDELAMMKVVHNVNFLPYQCLFHGMTNWNELGSEYMLGLQFATSMDNSKGPGTDLFQDVVMIIDTVFGLDLNRLRDILSINIKDKLVIVSDFTLLSSNLLACIRIN